MSRFERSKAVQRPARLVPRSRSRGPRTPGLRFVPRVDPMENRTLLSILKVTNNRDGVNVPGSLRSEIAQASPGDTIKFASGLKGQIITLSQGPITITENLTIRGFADNQPTISGGGLTRVFDIGGGASV